MGLRFISPDSGFNVQLQNTTDIKDNFGTVIKNIEVTRGPVVRLYAIFIVLVICAWIPLHYKPT